jgi:cell division protein FtsN
MKDYPEIEIELASHTDCRASDVYNIDLSQRRAESVVKYLVENGISARRMRARGYGETQLKNGCADGVQCSEEEHQRNRRTEVKIIKGANNAKISVVDNLPKYIDAKPGATTPSSPIYASTDDKLYDIPSAKNAATTSKNTSVENTTSGRFWVVAGSFSNAQNAVEQQLKMLNLGFPETTIEYSAETNTNRVVVGKMESMEAANQRVKELKSKGQSGLFVLQK